MKTSLILAMTFLFINGCAQDNSAQQSRSVSGNSAAVEKAEQKNVASDKTAAQINAQDQLGIENTNRSEKFAYYKKADGNYYVNQVAKEELAAKGVNSQAQINEYFEKGDGLSLQAAAPGGCENEVTTSIKTLPDGSVCTIKHTKIFERKSQAKTLTCNITTRNENGAKSCVNGDTAGSAKAMCNWNFVKRATGGSMTCSDITSDYDIKGVTISQNFSCSDQNSSQPKSKSGKSWSSPDSTTNFDVCRLAINGGNGITDGLGSCIDANEQKSTTNHNYSCSWCQHVSDRTETDCTTPAKPKCATTEGTLKLFGVDAECIEEEASSDDSLPDYELPVDTGSSSPIEPDYEFYPADFSL